MIPQTRAEEIQRWEAQRKTRSQLEQRTRAIMEDLSRYASELQKLDARDPRIFAVNRLWRELHGRLK